MIVIRVFLAGAILLLGAAPALASGLSEGPVRPTPPAYSAFCGAYPGLCRATAEPPVALTDRRLAELAAVQRQINQAIAWERDGAIDIASDRWHVLPIGGDRPRGDCADFTMTKLAELAARGWPLSSLRPALVFLMPGAPANGPHMVLTVETDAGTFVLDHLQADVLPIDAPAFAPYYFFLRRGAGDDWRRVTRPAH